MINGKRIIGIVPARSGSKGIPNKNIRPLAGKPLLGWAVESGLASGVLDAVYLATDSAEYAEIGKQCGASVPILLASHVATDTSHVFLAMKWFLQELAKSGERPDYVALLEPTAPARQPAHIKDLAELVVTNSADAGFTVMEVPAGFNAHWQIGVDPAGKARLALGGPVSGMIRRRQLLPPLFVRGGSTYLCRTGCLLKDEPDMYGEDLRALKVHSKYSVDLDTEEDWAEAERQIPALHSGR